MTERAGASSQPNVNLRDVIRFRAVQAEFPAVSASLTCNPNQPTLPGVVELDVIPSNGNVTQPRISAAALCEQACVFNPNTKNPEIRSLRETGGIDIECSGIQVGSSATLTLSTPLGVNDVLATAPCGMKFSETEVPAIILGSKPEKEEQPAELKKYPWWNLLGRYVTHSIKDYTENVALLKPDDIKFLNDNNDKHVHALKMALGSLSSISTGLMLAQSDALNALVLQGSFGSMAVFGGAWFVISFSSIRSEFTKAAISTTRNMLIPLEISMASTLSALTAAAIKIDQPVAAALVLTPFVYAFERGISAVVAFDTADAFNRGLTGEEQDYYKRQMQVLEAIGITPNMSPTEVRGTLRVWRASPDNTPHPIS